MLLHRNFTICRTVLFQPTKVIYTIHMLPQSAKYDHHYNIIICIQKHLTNILIVRMNIYYKLLSS